MWKWCLELDIDIKHLAMQFCLNAPVDGIVMTGPSNRNQLQDAYDAATQEVATETWEEFKEVFGLSV